MRKFALIIALFASFVSAFACTSVIISGKRTYNGKPMMLKHRDTGCLDNRIQRYTVGDVSFIGLVNAPVDSAEVWTGTNSLGFSIMNTASYNFAEDKQKVPFCDKEGEVMFKALAVCATVQDFLNLLDTLPKPLGVEANFGVIDQQGGAMYVECNNWRYVTYDVNQEPEGYKVQTNFSFAGRKAEYMGWERYLTASAVMKEMAEEYTGKTFPVDHSWFFNHLSRSYRHEKLGTPADYCPESGIIVDQDFIPRRITSASIVIEGDVMWTLLGYPACGVALPLIVGEKDVLPAAVKKSTKDGHCLISDINMQMKMDYLFPDKISNGKYYLHVNPIFKGVNNEVPMLTCARQAEDEINEEFSKLYQKWQSGKICRKSFYEQYEKMANGWVKIYQKHFAPYLNKNK